MDNSTANSISSAENLLSTDIDLLSLATEDPCSYLQHQIQQEQIFGHRFPYRLWVNITVVPVLVIFGLIGNTLSWLVVDRVSFGFPSTKVLIKSLALFDILYLVGSIFFQTLRGVQLDTKWMGTVVIYQYIHPYVWPYMTTIQCTETWLVVCIAIDRFVAIHYPLHASQLCTKRRAFTAAIAIFFLSFFYSLPHFFEFTVGEKLDECTGEIEKTIAATDLFTDKTYQLVYWSVITILLRFAIPLSALLFLTISLIIGINQAARRRNRLTNMNRETASDKKQENGDHTKMQKKTDSVTPVLLSVVVMFILCESVEFTMHIIQTLRWMDPGYKERENKAAQAAANLTGNTLLTLSAAVNFLLYVAFAKVFQRGLKELFCKGNGKSGYAFKSGSSTVISGSKMSINSTNTVASTVIEIPQKTTF